MISMILKFLGGGGISSIGEQINRAIEIRERAKTDKARLEADQNIEHLRTARDIEVKQLEARSNEKPDLFTQITRLSLASLAFLILLKMSADYISTSRIDPVPEQLWWFVGLVVAWCFWGKPWGKR